MHSIRNTLVAALVATLAAAPAFAAPGQGKGGGNKGGGPAAVQKHGGKHVSGKHAVTARKDGKRVSGRQAQGKQAQARLSDNRRLYSSRSYDGHDRRYGYDTRVLGAGAGCPPGLAKKDNGCLPPGQAKKLVIGQHLPPGAVYVVPPHVLATLPPPPLGYRYAVVYDRVVLVSSGDIIVDILRSLIG